MIYRYRCSSDACKAQVERIQSIKDPVPDTVSCTFCDGIAEKIVEAPAVLTGGMTTSKQPIDVAIGSMAAARHEVIAERQAVRDGVRRKSGKVGIHADGYSDFKPINESTQKKRSAAIKQVEKDGFKPTYDGAEARLVKE